jgi:hypothetical protein
MLDDDSLPAIYRSADQASLRGQRGAVVQIRWSLWLGVIAAATGITSWRWGDAALDVMALVGGVAFAAAFVLTLRLNAEGYETQWYRGRAVAESVKTLAWRYAVGGDPFGKGPAGDAQVEVEAGQRFATRIRRVFAGAGDLRFGPAPGEQITAAMSALRARSLADRREAYITGRVGEQADRYASKAADNAAKARRWAAVGVLANLFGLLAAIARFLGWLDVDLLGIAAAVAGAATAWSQFRQHRTLAAAYALTAQELSLVREELRLVTTEPEWALAMSDAEDAISREHTMWLARHGHAPV